jgi:putative membrane protein
MTAAVGEIAIEKSMRLIARGMAAGRLKTISAGLEFIPPAGPAVIVARHYHHLFDGLALFAALPRPFHILVTLDWAQNRAVRGMMTALTRTARWPVLLRTDAAHRGSQTGGAFSVTDVLRYQRTALRDAVQLLAEGRVLIVFPEGYPNIDPHYTPKTRRDEFLPFKPGFLRIVLAAEKRMARVIPLIPAGIHYVPGRPWTAYLRFGPPADREGCQGQPLISRLEAEVQKLSSDN